MTEVDFPGTVAVMASTTAVTQQAAPDHAASPKGAVRAHRNVLAVFGFVFVAITVGRSWDGLWHTTHEFDDFFSPPHIFIYSCVAAAMVLYARILLRPDLTRWFGAPVRVPVAGVRVPGSLLNLGLGLAVIGAAGVFDATWHTLFGLDETNWSTPHAMLGWGIFLAVLGYVSCRLALDATHPTSGVGKAIIAAIVVFAAMAPSMGPIGQIRGPAETERVARIPVLAADENAQHGFRVLLEYNINRTHPVFVVLVALWAVGVVALLRRLDRRTGFVLGVCGAITLFQFGGRRAPDGLEYVLPPPVIVAALLVVGIIAAGRSERLAWAVAGLGTGVAAFLGWGLAGDPAVALALVPLTPVVGVVGGWLGRFVWQTIAEPTAKRTLALGVLGGIGCPLATGLVDLYMRSSVP